jgi:hypothetical protein
MAVMSIAAKIGCTAQTARACRFRGGHLLG